MRISSNIGITISAESLVGLIRRKSAILAVAGILAPKVHVCGSRLLGRDSIFEFLDGDFGDARVGDDLTASVRVRRRRRYLRIGEGALRADRRFRNRGPRYRFPANAATAFRITSHMLPLVETSGRAQPVDSRLWFDTFSQPPESQRGHKRSCRCAQPRYQRWAESL